MSGVHHVPYVPMPGVLFTEAFIKYVKYYKRNEIQTLQKSQKNLNKSFGAGDYFVFAKSNITAIDKRI